MNIKLALSEMVLAFYAELESENFKPEILGAESLGMDEEGYTRAFITFHRGKPEHVTERAYRFHWDNFENRVIVTS